MAIENAKMLNVRIKNKYDSYENWAASGLVLEAGEIAIAYTTVDVKVDNGTAKHPALLMKVGNGTDTFANLPWMSAKAADVLAVCKNEAELKTFINGVIADAGIASSDAMEALAGRVTTAEGEIDALQTAVGDANNGLVKAVAVLEGLVGGTEVSEQISTAIANLNLATTYAAKEHKHEIADVNGLEDRLVAAKKAGDDAAAALGEYKTTNNAAVENINNAISAIKDSDTIDSFADVVAALAGKQATGDYATKTEAQGYADAKDAAIQAAHKAGTDAAAAAAQALVDAKAYTDGFTGGKTVSASINETIANYSTTAQMNTAIATAKGEAVSHADGLNTAMDARVLVVEGKAHTHTFVESELNLIKSGDVAKWNAAEQNAKDYADGLDEAMDARVLALEGKFTGNDSVAKQIEDAVAAEAALREAADAGLQEQVTANANAIAAMDELVGDKKVSEAIAEAVKAEEDRAKGIEGGLETRLAAVEADYLKAADKTELEGKIQSNTDAIALLTNGVDPDVVDGVNDLIAYVAEHGTEVTGIKADIKQNADDIDALEGRMATAEGAIALKAAQADLEALDGRVTTVEGKVTTLEGEMDSAEGRLTALEGLTGGKKVSEAISEAIEALKIGDYAKAADLTAAINQHNTDKAALEASIAKKANDADLAAIAKTGSTDDLVQGSMVLVFDCGTSAV